jgi:hypothetical protein
MSRSVLLVVLISTAALADPKQVCVCVCCVCGWVCFPWRFGNFILPFGPLHMHSGDHRAAFVHPPHLPRFATVGRTRLTRQYMRTVVPLRSISSRTHPLYTGLCFAHQWARIQTRIFTSATAACGYTCVMCARVCMCVRVCVRVRACVWCRTLRRRRTKTLQMWTSLKRSTPHWISRTAFQRPRREGLDLGRLVEGWTTRAQHTRLTSTIARAQERARCSSSIAHGSNASIPMPRSRGRLPHQPNSRR